MVNRRKRSDLSWLCTIAYIFSMALAAERERGGASLDFRQMLVSRLNWVDFSLALGMNTCHSAQPRIQTE